MAINSDELAKLHAEREATKLHRAERAVTQLEEAFRAEREVTRLEDTMFQAERAILAPYTAALAECVPLPATVHDVEADEEPSPVGYIENVYAEGVKVGPSLLLRRKKRG